MHAAPETSAGPIGTNDGLEVRIFGDVAVPTLYRIGTVMYDKGTVGNWRIGPRMTFHRINGMWAKSCVEISSPRLHP